MISEICGTLTTLANGISSIALGYKPVTVSDLPRLMLADKQDLFLLAIAME